MTADPPSKEDLELLKTAIFGTTADTDVDADTAEVDDDDTFTEVDDASESVATTEVSHALAVAATLGDIKGSGLQDIVDGLRELDMDNYDDEDEGVEIFGKSDTYYPSNELDPYLKNKDDVEYDDEEDIEDMTIKPTDSVIVCARNEDEVSELELKCLKVYARPKLFEAQEAVEDYDKTFSGAAKVSPISKENERIRIF